MWVSSVTKIRMVTLTEESSIAEFFENKSVFITGVTGFIGKLILLKLLRNCPRIANAYVLIREKKGKPAAERFSEILTSSEPFQKLIAERPEILQKVTAVSGDIEKPNLGISSHDEERLRNEVFVIIHAAAVVRFDRLIQETLETNFQGLSKMLQLARNVRNLQAFVHISTAYSNCNRKTIEEKIYPTQFTPETVIELLAGISAEEAVALSAKLLEGRPNTYTFAKSLAEQLMDSYRKELPVCIVRPSIVSASQSDPFPGWIEGWNGATGVIAAMLHGFQRFILVGSKKWKLDLIPVDHVVNLVISAAWFTATAPKLGKEPYFVYNCCSGGSNPISSGRVTQLIQEAAWLTPLPKAFRYPAISFVTNKCLYRSCDLIFHRLPYQIMDWATKALSQESRMTRAYEKMSKMLDALSFFLTSEFDFSTENTKGLYGQLSPVDKQLFNFDINSFDWEPYMYDYAAGIRKYLLHEPDERLEVDRLRHKRLYVFHWVFRGLTASLILVGFLAVLIYWLV